MMKKRKNDGITLTEQTSGTLLETWIFIKVGGGMNNAAGHNLEATIDLSNFRSKGQSIRTDILGLSNTVEQQTGKDEFCF